MMRIVRYYNLFYGVLGELRMGFTDDRIDDITEALQWLGYPPDRINDIDITEGGEVWLGLTMLLPKKAGLYA